MLFEGFFDVDTCYIEMSEFLNTEHTLQGILS